MKQTKLALMLAAVAFVGLTGCQAINHQNQPSVNHSNVQEVRTINQVTWYKSNANTENRNQLTNSSNLLAQRSRLVFIRTPDQNNRHSSTNIGIDDRFQVSLQGGHHSEVVTCTGRHKLSVQATGNLSNDLSKTAQIYNFTPNQTYYFLVTPSQTTTSLRPIDPQIALKLLDNSRQQTHQISRVINDCTNQPQTLKKIDMPVVTVVPSTAISQKAISQEPVITEKEVQSESQITLEKPINIEIVFDFDSATILPNKYPQLEHIAQYMQQNPQVQASIEGHTDSQGAAAYNKQLSSQRANAVKSMLINKFGIDAQRLTTVGHGESQPIANNATAEGRKQNRRVVAIIFNSTDK